MNASEIRRDVLRGLWGQGGTPHKAWSVHATLCTGRPETDVRAIPIPGMQSSRFAKDHTPPTFAIAGRLGCDEAVSDLTFTTSGPLDSFPGRGRAATAG